MSPYENHLTTLLEYLSQICPKLSSMTEVKLRLIFFWAEWHCATEFGKPLTATSWSIGELGPEASPFTDAVNRLWRGKGPYPSSSFDLADYEKICLEAAVHHLGTIGIRLAMEEVCKLWVSRQAIWSHPIDMVKQGKRYKDPTLYKTTKRMNREELLSGEYSADDM